MLATVPEEKRNAWRAHRVGDSDSLASIARRYRVTESSIVAVNDAAEEALQPGDLLVIPAALEREPKRAPAKRSIQKQSASRKTTVRKASQRASASAKRRSGKHCPIAARARARPPRTAWAFLNFFAAYILPSQ